MGADIGVIIPTVRDPSVIRRYAQNAIYHRFPLDRLEFIVLTEDFADKSKYQHEFEKMGLDGIVFDQSGRDEFLKSSGVERFAGIFPKQSHAETSFGIFYSWIREHKYDVLIDDDTFPLDTHDYFGEHLDNLEYSGTIAEASSSSRWVNVLHKNFGRHRLYPRGYPYGAMNEVIRLEQKHISKVVLSQGLWTNIPDLDAVRILNDGDLNGQSRTRTQESDYGPNFTVTRGNYTTVCSMNLAFKTLLAPAFYQFPMDDNPWKIGRFDDIWSGVVSKKICDTFGYSIVCGSPLCRHDKAPRSTFRDLSAEAPGLQANEKFYGVVDSARGDGNSIADMVDSIATKLEGSDHEFIRYCGTYTKKWLELLECFD
ncbi:MAG: alpha-1 4-glucan-protein synthase [Nitrososphaerota archaeon]|nr:alpha-1 4-glucan-protein synthase [Nitrososphaerota archaeon]